MAIIYILIRILVYYFNLWLNIMIALGLFLPQIIKNFKYRLYQNIRFEYIFLLGIQSYYPLYFYACPYNVYLNEASSSDFIIWSAVNCICVSYILFRSLFLCSKNCLAANDFLIKKHLRKSFTAMLTNMSQMRDSRFQLAQFAYNLWLTNKWKE